MSKLVVKTRVSGCRLSMQVLQQPPEMRGRRYLARLPKNKHFTALHSMHFPDLYPYSVYVRGTEFARDRTEVHRDFPDHHTALAARKELMALVDQANHWVAKTQKIKTRSPIKSLDEQEAVFLYLLRVDALIRRNQKRNDQVSFRCAGQRDAIAWVMGHLCRDVLREKRVKQKRSQP